jgi:hypothetical protein
MIVMVGLGIAFLLFMAFLNVVRNRESGQSRTCCLRP